jgi:hypothetical protein
LARIPNDELERIKAEVSLVRLVEAAGIELVRHGKDLVGLCPFHDDREPVAGGDSVEEPVALFGGVPGGRVGG